MKLKTRLKIAWVELVFITLVLMLAVYVDVVRSQGRSLAGVLADLLLPILLLAPLCVTSWRRLRQTRAQLAEQGPEAEPSADLWTAPGAPGLIGVAIVAVAVAAALVPALLLRG